MIQRNGKLILLNQEGIPVHDMGCHFKFASQGYKTIFSPMTFRGAGAQQMPVMSGLQKKDWVRAFLFVKRCRKRTGVLPEFCVGHTSKKHVILPLGWGQGADRVSQDTQIGLTEISDEVGGRVYRHNDQPGKYF